MKPNNIAAGLDTGIPHIDATDLSELLQPDKPPNRPPGDALDIHDQSHRQRVHRRIFYDFSQVANATRLIKQLPTENETIHCVMDGTFNGIALVPAVIELARQPVNSLTITTLGFNLRNIECLIEMAERGQIKHLQMVCSDYFDKANKGEYAQALRRFSTIGATLKSSMNHSKILLFDFPDQAYVVESSANLRSCNNMEQFCLTNSRPLMDFHAKWIARMLA